MSNSELKWDFFIAHAGPDKEIAEEFYFGLEKEARTFLDSKSIIPGDDWDIELAKAQKNSLISVVLISSKTERAYYQREEIAAAIAYARKNPNDHRVIPVYLDDACRDNDEIPYGLRLKHSINISSSCTIQNAISKLLEVPRLIKKKQTKDSVSVTPLEKLVTKFFDVPFKENPAFTGREDELKELRERLTSGGRSVLTQAIRGLGGIGKTQLAVEYAYRYQDEYEYVFWMQLTDDKISEEAGTSSDPSLLLLNSYVGYCNKLQIPFNETEAETAIHAFKQWMEQHHNWLLIFDNADQPDCLISFLPIQSQGHILLTSRASSFDALGILNPIEVDKLPPDQATEFLMKRVAHDLNESEQSFARELAEELDGLPLALEQAGAYIHKNKVTSFENYLNRYRKLKLTLLEKQEPVLGGYSKSVETTWLINFQEVEAESKASADVLRLSSYLAANSIPIELITQGAIYLSEPIQNFLAQSNDDISELLQPLLNYSLIQMVPGENTFSIHRLVQEVMKVEVRLRDEQSIWQERVVNSVNEIYPWPEHGNWHDCRRLSSQSMIAIDYIKQSKFETEYSANLSSKLGRYFYDVGQYEEAEILFLQSIEISRAIFGENHPCFGVCLNNLAGLYRTQGRYDEAETLCLQAIEICRVVFGEDHLNFGGSLNNLAGLYRTQGRYDEAEPLCLQAMEICRTSLGEKHPLFATSLNNLALLYEKQGRYEKAEPLYLQAINIRSSVLGVRHPEFATSLNNLALLYGNQGHYEKAEPLLQQSLEIRRAVLGEKHPTYGTSLNNLASLYERQNRLKEAEPLYLQDLEIRRAALGEKHPDCATSLNNLALLYQKQERYKDAEQLFLQAIEMSREFLGEKHPDYAKKINNLATLYIDEGRYKDAESLCLKAIEISRTGLVNNHPFFATSLNNLACLYHKQGRFEDAEPLYLQAIKIVKSKPGSEDPELKKYMNNYQQCKEAKDGNNVET